MSLDQSYILFEVNGGVYGLKCAEVQHIEMLEHVTPVPNTAPAVEGVVFSRGRVFPALNLRIRFGAPREPHTLQTRLIFLKVQERVVGLIVDAAREFHQIPASAIRPVGDSLVGIEGNYVQGLTTVKGRSVLILDVAKVLAIDDVQLPIDDSLPVVTSD
jgi:purine-binding chemotaxis protein CheW